MRIAHAILLASILLGQPTPAGTYPSGGATQSFSQPDATVLLSDGSTIGSDFQTVDGLPEAGVYNGTLRLADQGTTNSIGSFKLPDLDPGNVIKSFDLNFSVVMSSLAGTEAGEGWSVNFGAIPPDNGTGEGGFVPLPRGLSVAFEARDELDRLTAIEVFVGGVSVGRFPSSFPLDGVARSLSLHWDNFGLDLIYDNKTIVSDFSISGFSPGIGDTFAFSARTTDATMDVSLDNLRATTTALPVLNTGGLIISEFVANNSELEDEFGAKPSWIELFNGTPQSIDLTGWFLTDSKKNLTKWRISGATLTPYNYQVIFASGKDRQLSTTSFLHASFTLAKSGGFVALVRPDGTIASSYDYTQQDKDVSFGEQGSDRTRGYMYPASPGTVNTMRPAPASFSPEVQFSHPGGLISEPVPLALSVPVLPGIEIRYTLDRTEPGPNSSLYSNALSVTQITMVRARSFAPGHLPGQVTSRSYVTMDGSLTNYAGTGKVFDSNLPLVYLDTFGFNVDGSTGGTRPYRPSYALIIPPDPSTGRASLTNLPDYSGPAGTHVHGESSATFDQRTYALELWDERGGGQNAALFGMPSDSDWILYGPWSEKTLMRNKLIDDWMLAFRGEDGTAVRSRFVEVFFNQTRPANGQISFGSTYRGVYVLMEKIKHGKNRVPVEKLNEKTIDPELITGGYIIRADKPDPIKNTWGTLSGFSLQSFDPDRFNTPQLNYIKGYIASFEKALKGSEFKDFTRGYQAYIDPDTFIDAQWMLEFSKQVDGYTFSTYWFKDRAARLRAGPIWDFNIALGNASYAGGDIPTGWYQGNNGGLWYPRLHADPEYHLAHWDRYWQMRRTIWDTNAIIAKIDENARTLLDGYAGLVSNRAPANIQNPIARQFRRYPRLGTVDWPNPGKEGTIRNWQGELDYMKSWIMTRIAWLDDQSMLAANNVVLRPPDFSENGGRIVRPMLVALAPYRRPGAAQTFPDGDIYYTLDNSDPRLTGGAIRAAALKYSQPIAVTSSLTVNARLYGLHQWSPLASATYFLDPLPANSSNLVVSEIMYTPAPLTPAETNALLVNPQGFEFIELRNIATEAVDLTGVKFADGIAFDFAAASSPCHLLQPGQSALLVSDKRAFMVRYPYIDPRKILGQFRGHLDGGGENLTLTAADGTIIKSLNYGSNSAWPDPQDSGKSIILKSPLANLDSAEGSGWILSAKAGGSPGESGLGSDTFSGDPAQDTDGDGLPDLFEFFSGTDPEDPGSSSRSSVGSESLVVNGKAGNYLTFRFNRRAGVLGLRMTIERSLNLAIWAADPSTLVFSGSQTNRDGTLTDAYRGVAPLSENTGSAFYRLKLQTE